MKKILSRLFNKPISKKPKPTIRKSVNLSNLSELTAERNRIGKEILKGPNSKLFKSTVLLASEINKKKLSEIKVIDIVNKNFTKYPSMKEDVLLYLKYDFMIRSNREHSPKK
ncbi:MAG: hypothetical protein WCY27_03440 [archaeon]|nr:hypothetical protein [archaeon]MDD2477494.1 hypothetical protein [Candidatus ainarchaeum sp.]MDD3084762.1 hypothetical protein [Candidatus ainarchaeum sp.]MDD4221438.1 hypothetical protein [Candidatus ainarchaeum sp.]MDD4662403.1 hypothetical protein [Candidatus ainarchaeum sp.]